MGRTGRTSTAPSQAAGMVAATWIAWSRSVHSSTKQPVSPSLVSA